MDYQHLICETLDGIEVARRMIVREALRLDGVRQPVARTWLAVKRKLEKMPEHTLTMAEWDALCGKKVSTAEGRRQSAPLVDAAIAAWTSQLASKDVAIALQPGVPAAAVATAGSILADEHLGCRDALQCIDDPEAGTFLLPSAPWLVDGVRPPIARAGPVVGEDNEAIYMGLLGWPGARLQLAIEEGLVR